MFYNFLSRRAQYDEPINGDLHVVVPGRFIAFKGPDDDLPAGRRWSGGPSIIILLLLYAWYNTMYIIPSRAPTTTSPPAAAGPPSCRVSWRDYMSITRISVTEWQ